MASFSRGFASFVHHQSFRLPSSIRIALFSARTQIPQRGGLRLGNIPFLHNNVGPSKVLRAGYRSPPSYMVSDPVIRKVLTTKQPVLLYKAPDRRLYMVYVYGLACATIAAGLYALRFRYTLSDDLPFFVGPTYIVVGFILIAIGCYIFTAPVSRCSSIELIPNRSGSGVQFLIKARTIPMTGDRVIYAGLGEATVREKTKPVALELAEAQRARTQSLRDGLEDMFIARRMWELAARWIDQKWTSFFLRFKFAVLRFGVVPMTVEGSKWKIDCSGYLLEEGQAIDRLMPTE